MKLRLVKQGNFLGTKCDFYVDENNDIYMSRTQIGYALGYKNPSKGVENVHNRHCERLNKFSVLVRGAQIEGGSKHIDPNQEIYMYTERGIYAICRYSSQPIADKFDDWVYDTISSIRKNGYYIASEKDEKWLSIRQETKQVRRMETDTIKKFVEYAKAQGSTHADTYYMNFTKLVQSQLGIAPGERDVQDQKVLMRLKSLETIVDMHIETLMKEKAPYKEIYKGVCDLIHSI